MSSDNMQHANLLCPVCKEVMDKVRYNPMYKAMVLAALGGDARAEHAGHSPACARHEDWFNGWIVEETDGPSPTTPST
jgi:hypothetical protein